jgi:hypothetical protein
VGVIDVRTKFLRSSREWREEAKVLAVEGSRVPHSSRFSMSGKEFLRDPERLK